MNGLCECGCGLAAPIATMTRHERGQVKGQPMRFIPHHGIRHFVSLGSRFGCWTIESESARNRFNQRMFTARCDCGTVRDVALQALTKGVSVSCGCQRGTHRQTCEGHRTLTYVSWVQMRQRCLNPHHHAWAQYGGRGITICPEWERFETFVADMGSRPPGYSIDRIDNNGNYEPANCRWATKAQQRVNQTPYSSARLEQLARARAARAERRATVTP